MLGCLHQQRDHHGFQQVGQVLVEFQVGLGVMGLMVLRVELWCSKKTNIQTKWVGVGEEVLILD